MDHLQFQFRQHKTWHSFRCQSNFRCLLVHQQRLFVFLLLEATKSIILQSKKQRRLKAKQSARLIFWRPFPYPLLKKKNKKTYNLFLVYQISTNSTNIFKNFSIFFTNKNRLKNIDKKMKNKKISQKI